MSALVLSTIVFVICYVLIATERVDKTITALAGGLAIIVLNIIPQEQAFAEVDWNVIFLLIGMMVIVNILRRSGIFQWLAVKSLKLARGQPFRLLVILSVLTAVLSALLDNVTTVVLVAPLTVVVAAHLKVSPVPFLVSEILASNIGGTATLIGDPPNIIIGSAAGLDFVAFLNALAPVATTILVFYLLAARFIFRGQMQVAEENREAAMAMSEVELITDPRLLAISLVVLALTIGGFVAHGWLGYEPGTVALTGAVLLLLLSRLEPHTALGEVEWPTIFFFIGLFILVEGVVKAGLIELLSNWALSLTQGNLVFTTFLLLWLSAILSGFVDNIPYTATMVPVIKDLGEHMPILPLWWSLALGACLGGNLTIVGASANVIVVGIAARSGHPISFGTFFRYGALVTFVSMVISSVYLFVRYLG